MRRGEIWTVASGSDYTGKPRPAAILQDDRFDATGSVTICLFTNDATDAPLLRILVEPGAENGLDAPCRLMVDKLTTVRRTGLGTRLGHLREEDMSRLHQAVLVFLGFAGSRRASGEKMGG